MYFLEGVICDVWFPRNFFKDSLFDISYVEIQELCDNFSLHNKANERFHDIVTHKEVIPRREISDISRVVGLRFEYIFNKKKEIPFLSEREIMESKTRERNYI